jgi:hypothetical protein
MLLPLLLLLFLLLRGSRKWRGSHFKEAAEGRVLGLAALESARAQVLVRKIHAVYLEQFGLTRGVSEPRSSALGKRRRRRMHADEAADVPRVRR